MASSLARGELVGSKAVIVTGPRWLASASREARDSVNRPVAVTSKVRSRGITAQLAQATAARATVGATSHDTLTAVRRTVCHSVATPRQKAVALTKYTPSARWGAPRAKASRWST